MAKKNVNSKGFGEYTVTVKFKNGHVQKASCIVVPEFLYSTCSNDYSVTVRSSDDNRGVMLACTKIGNKAVFLDADGTIYKRYSGCDVVVSSKEYGEGKVYYESKNHKLTKPTKFNPRTDYYRPWYKNQKNSEYVYKIKNSKKGRYVTFKFYIKVNNKKYYGYSQTCKITS